MGHLRLYFLGRFQARIDGKPVGGFAYDKVRALLAYLAVESRHAHSREWLATLLWPESSPESGRTSLRKALSTLRKAICDGGSTSPHLFITRDTVQFNPESDYWLDVDEAESRFESSLEHTHLHIDTCPTCIAQLEEAASLYQGDFLHGLMVDSLEFEEWSLILREHLQSRLLTALYHLSNYHLRRGAYHQAQTYALRQVEMEPYREEAHRTLMLCLARNGQRSAALAQYVRCQRVLEDELGVEPGSETRELYERIRSAGEIRPHNLPAPGHPLVGREAELQQIARRLAKPECRLLTLAGMGGIGKTALAIAAAREQLGAFLHGVFLVPLLALESAELIAPAIADTLGFRFTGPRPLADQLADFIGKKELLLVLDNFEHLHDGAGILDRLLKSAPHLKLLVTSRERLKLRAEWVIQLNGLDCPPHGDGSVDDVELYSAVQCFCSLGQHIAAGLLDTPENRQGISRICRLTGGVPLGIELAASWVTQFSPTQIADEIERNLDILSTTLRDVPPRQRSMRAAFEYSWALLSPKEQEVFQRLTVFRGGFDRTTACPVAGASPELLTALLDKNLIYRQSDSRCSIHPLVDQFAAEKLACLPETERTTRERHCVYFMEFTAMKAADYRRERQPAALDRLDAEFGNIQSAWQYAARTGRWPEVDLALEGMFLFYDVRSRFREGQETLDGTLQAMRQIDELSSDQRRILGRLLARLGRLEIYLGQQARAEELLSESLENLKDFPAVMEYAAALSYQGIICHYRGQPSQAYAYAADSLRLSQQTGNRDGEAFCLNLLGNLAQSQGDYNQAQAHYRQNLAIREELHDDFGVAIACNNLGNLAHARGRLEEAQAFYERSCASFERIGYSLGLATGLTNAGFVSMKLGRTGEAQAMLERSLRLKRDLGQPLGIANTLANLGELACRTGKLKEAAEYLRDAMDIAMQLKAIPLAVELLACFATLFVKQGKKQTALELLALADAHPSARHETRARAAELLSQLESELPREEFMAAQERGRQLQLEAIAEELSLTQQRRIV